MCVEMAREQVRKKVKEKEGTKILCDYALMYILYMNTEIKSFLELSFPFNFDCFYRPQIIY